MGLLVLLGIRLAPVGLMILLRGPGASPLLAILAVLASVALVLVGQYADDLRATCALYAHQPEAARIQQHLNRVVYLRLFTWAAYIVSLVLLVVI